MKGARSCPWLVVDSEQAAPSTQCAPDLAKDYTSIAPYYDASRYGGRKARFTSHCEVQVLRRAIRRFAPRRGRLIDVACGTGNFTHELADLFDTVVGVDLTAEMLRRARGKQAEDRGQTIRFVQGSATALPFPQECADVVLSTRFLHLFPRVEHGRLLELFASLLKPGGILIVDHDSPLLEWMDHVGGRLRGRPRQGWSSYHPAETPAGLRRRCRLGVSAPGLPTLSLISRGTARGMASWFVRGPLVRLSTFSVVVYERA